MLQKSLAYNIHAAHFIEMTFYIAQLFCRLVAASEEKKRKFESGYNGRYFNRAMGSHLRQCPRLLYYHHCNLYKYSFQQLPDI
ncbi:hypothetical protein K450DRAFT_228043 [Umbelopsis ramanniana AG]|uniref:Uncharacterized protein n=1 Tax=Umbelopsis ramanniana AG TaxID=1314678 RepID=A0AAD5HH49_UMBRA|nr:uncharacterized protein K450DRAFT_228043 [Umbelopsis ramanniana AG]KAI8582241.1 hypothetical protein K450DRAFT_228043 [Umbelopsis ramanniana AG]